MLSTNTPIVTTSSARATGNTISSQLWFIRCEIEDQEYSVGFNWLLPLSRCVVRLPRATAEARATILEVRA